MVTIKSWPVVASKNLGYVIFGGKEVPSDNCLTCHSEIISGYSYCDSCFNSMNWKDKS